MIRKVIIIIGIIFCAMAKAANAQVHFQQDTSWQQIVKKAKKQGKYIFVDCYATWCGPCKMMDKTVYTDTVLSRYMNDNFVSVKVQMDSTKNDGSTVRAWYKFARQFGKEYHIEAFPSFMFFSPDGKPLHKETGYLETFDFIQVLLDAKNHDHQEFALLADYRKGELPDWQVPSMISALARSGNKATADSIASQFTQDYLVKLPDELLFKKLTLVLIGEYIKKVDSFSFTWFFRHKQRIDPVAGKDYTDQILAGVINRQEIEPALWSDAEKKNPKVQNPDWKAIYDDIAKRYDKQLADRSLLNPQITWFQQHKQWLEACEVVAKKAELLCFDGNGKLFPQYVGWLNDVNYNYFVVHGTDQQIIRKAIAWQEQVINKNPDPGLIDTYADLLYKGGNQKEAITQEQIAVNMQQKRLDEQKTAFSKSNQHDILAQQSLSIVQNELRYLRILQEDLSTFESTLQKMKDNEMTWNK